MSTPKTNEDVKLLEIMKKLEQKGEQDLLKLKHQNCINVNKDALGINTLNAIKNGTIKENAIVNILQQGADEFEKEMGRKMTYGEMREMYG
jgi:hypothetical protein